MKTKWWVDLALFAGFIIAFFLDFTGLELHQWIGLLGAGLAAYHLIAHRSWVNAVTRRFLHSTSVQARRFYLLDASLLVGFLTILGTGLAISTWFNLALASASAWLTLHIAASIVTLLLVVLKLGLHWRWILTAVRSVFTSPAPACRQQPGLQAAQAQVAQIRQMGRREFLQVMSVTGAASFIALLSAINSLPDGSVADSPSLTDLATSSKSDSVQSTRASDVAVYSVQCQRGCSFPGRCRRFTDSNGNNRCDLGECL